MLKSYD